MRKVAVQLIISVAICTVAGHIASSICSQQIIFNADTFAPIYQAKLISEGISLDPRELRFARIPSIFPDLATLIMLVKSQPSKEFHLIIENYSWFISTLFILLTSKFVHLSCSKRLSLPSVSIINTFTIIYLIKFSGGFQQAFGLLISPVHHGGNIVNSLLLGCLILWESNQPTKNPNKYQQISKYFLLSFTVFFGFISNKLILFTGIIPYAVALLILKYFGVKDRSYFKKSEPAKFFRQLSIIFPIFVAIIVLVIINNQCSFAMELQIANAGRQLFDLIISEPLYLILISTLLVTTVISLASKIRRPASLNNLLPTFLASSEQENISELIGLVFTLLFITSTLLYTSLLGNISSIPARYILPLHIGVSISLSLLASLSFIKLRSATFGKLTANVKRFLFIALAIPVTASFAITLYSIPVARLTSYRQVFSSNFQRRNSNLKPIIIYLKSNRLTNGLSDFWGTELAEASSLYLKNSTKISIEPINFDASPYLWAHSKKQFFNQTEPFSLKPYSFIISRDLVFLDKLRKKLGFVKMVKLPNGFQLIIFDRSNAGLYEFVRKSLIEGLAKTPVECI